MRFIILFFALLLISRTSESQNIFNPLLPGFESRIKEYTDTLKIIDTHEHLSDPEVFRKTNMLDFMLLLHNYNYDDMASSGMPDSAFDSLFNKPVPPREKWRIIEPYWKNSFNTASNRVAMIAAEKLYGISELNDSTVVLLSERIKKAYNRTDWYQYVLFNLCGIEYIIQDGDKLAFQKDRVRYAQRFSSWLTVRTKFRIDSLAVMQVEPIYTLEAFVNSMKTAFERNLKEGMVAVKFNLAYYRTLRFDRVQTETARRIFRSLVNGNENQSLSYADAKPLQDYLFYQLMDLARKHNIPVVFHTGLQAGRGNIIGNSDPTLLTNVFKDYPEIRFALFHGSYPFGGELSTLAKNYKNVYIDMNWTYAISPSYAERYLNEWLETVPANKIMAFGGDQRCVENIYGELIIARNIISRVLSGKVSDGYITENEAKAIARMILYDNAKQFYNLP